MANVMIVIWIKMKFPPKWKVKMANVTIAIWKMIRMKFPPNRWRHTSASWRRTE